MFISQNPSSVSLLKAIDEIYQNTLPVMKEVSDFESNLQSNYHQYVDKYPSDTLFKRVTKIFSNDSSLFVKFAKFTD